MLKNQLRKTEAGYRGETELEDLLFDETDEGLGHLEDEDLEWVKSIFNSSPTPICHRQNSDQQKLKSIAVEDAQMRARTGQAPPSRFNQNFNQNSLTWSARENDCTAAGYNNDKIDNSVACTINIYDRRFYDRNDIGLYYNTLETIVIVDPSLS